MKPPHFRDDRCNCEAHIPAKQAGAGTPAWLPRSHCDQERPPGIGSPPREGPQAPLRLRRDNLPAALDHLKKRSEFLAVAGTNRRYTTPGLVLQARTLTHVDQPETGVAEACPPRTAVRVGFTATKKVGNAVIRNRARRRLRAAVGAVLADMTARP